MSGVDSGEPNRHRVDRWILTAFVTIVFCCDCGSPSSPSDPLAYVSGVYDISVNVCTPPGVEVSQTVPVPLAFGLGRWTIGQQGNIVTSTFSDPPTVFNLGRSTSGSLTATAHNANRVQIGNLEWG